MSICVVLRPHFGAPRSGRIAYLSENADRQFGAVSVPASDEVKTLVTVIVM
jgi:hypothetical protein